MASRGQHCIWIRGASLRTPAPWLTLVMVLLLAGIATQTANAQAFTVVKNFSGAGDGPTLERASPRTQPGIFMGPPEREASTATA